MCPLQNVFYQNKYEYQVATAEDFLNFNYQFILKNCIFFTTFHFLMFSELPFLKKYTLHPLAKYKLTHLQKLAVALLCTHLHSCAHSCTILNAQLNHCKICMHT